MHSRSHVVTDACIHVNTQIYTRKHRLYSLFTRIHKQTYISENTHRQTYTSENTRARAQIYTSENTRTHTHTSKHTSFTSSSCCLSLVHHCTVLLPTTHFARLRLATKPFFPTRFYPDIRHGDRLAINDRGKNICKYRGLSLLYLSTYPSH